MYHIYVNKFLVMLLKYSPTGFLVCLTLYASLFYQRTYSSQVLRQQEEMGLTCIRLQGIQDTHMDVYTFYNIVSNLLFDHVVLNFH